MIVNYCFHVFGATIAELDAVSIEDLVEAVVLRKILISRFKKFLPILVDTFLLKGGLNQIMFLFAVTFVMSFCANKVVL